tara:strand:+ start:1273 stop:2568 length:1296 start_codon:yes stop_codon:yes gene_type:complete
MRKLGIIKDPRLAHLWRPYTQMKTEANPYTAVETRGAQIKLLDGRWLIDGISSWWTACHGYNHKHIIDAMHNQLDIMPHVMFGGLTHEPALKLSSRLASILPGKKSSKALTHIFFSDSGSVAIEVALKMATQYWLNLGEPNRNRFVCFKNAYHGDTIGAMSVCDPNDGMHAIFKGAIPEQIITEIPNSIKKFKEFEKLLEVNGRNIAGLIIEPLVQAAGGLKFHDTEILTNIYNICVRHNILFIADEIATGFGRTGSMFACDQADITPDIMCLGKALTGGTIGMAATAANAKVFSAFLSDEENKAFMHGPTYMANPLAVTAANASLDLFEDNQRLEQVKTIEDDLLVDLEPCRDIPSVVDVRVKGAIGVVQIKEPIDIHWLRHRFTDENVWVRPFENVIYLMPPFIINKGELKTLTKAILTVIKEWAVRTA